MPQTSDISKHCISRIQQLAQKGCKQSVKLKHQYLCIIPKSLLKLRTPGVSIHRIHIVPRSCWFVISLFVTILLVLCLWPHFLILIDTCSQIAIALLCLLFVAFSVITPKACRHWRPCWFSPYFTALDKIFLHWGPSILIKDWKLGVGVHAIQQRIATKWNTLRGNVFKW